MEKIKAGVKLIDIAKQKQSEYEYDILGAILDNELKDLGYITKNDCSLQFIDSKTSYGSRFYARSLTFLLIIAAKELFEPCRVTIEHSLSKGIYCEIHHGRELTLSDIHKIEEKMRELIKLDIPFERRLLPKSEALYLFEKSGMYDKVELMKYKEKEYISVYHCYGYNNYFYGYMVPSTGYLGHFELMPYNPGLILRFPIKSNPNQIPEFFEQKKLFGIFREFENWGRIMGLKDVADLDKVVAENRIDEIILISEALHEKKIAQIADMITNSIKDIKLVLVSGPSSSGKTTFANRLAIQLRVNGLKPIPISIDDYFKNREDTPKTPDGEYDFETIDAIDVDLFNDTMIKLINGEEVKLPTFNFHKGMREWQDKTLKISDEHILIVEGIHGLNESLTKYIPKDQKFKIYINALTHLGLDDHNRIPTSDLRLIRRIVRDFQFRSTDALTTIKRWDSVRRGEDKYIYPYQEEADVIFNSSLVYELSILKNIALLQLEKIEKDDIEYIEAKRLIKFLSYFIASKSNIIPYNSILREFIGSSCFFE